jgi:hypothetical protein
MSIEHSYKLQHAAVIAAKIFKFRGLYNSIATAISAVFAGILS